MKWNKDVLNLFSNLLVRKFVKDYKNTKDKKVREGYGYLGGVVGIIINLILFITKGIIGLLLNSIAVTADAFNNLSDVASSVITILGFKLASKPADKEHPFGHGRLEYISGLIVSFMVMLVGFQFIKASIERILNPKEVTFNLLSFILILLSIGAKIWISSFNKYVGRAINSSSLKASSFDALSDVVTSSCVAISLLSSKFTTFPLDGYIGVLVACFILYSGFSLIKETLNPLLGEAPDEELVNDIIEGVKSYDPITGVHDLIIHNYGPGRTMASIHAEVPSNVSILKIHEVIDEAERELSRKLDIYLVIHMDPISTDDKAVLKDKDYLEKILLDFNIIKSFHDFRVVGAGEIKNLIFDIVIDSKANLSEAEEETLKEDITARIKEQRPQYNTVITIDREFSHI